jgi:hypothetical protein
MMSEKRRMLGNGGGFDLSKTFDRDMVQLCPPQMRADEFRALSEVERRDAIIAAATAPEICGPDIPVSPARGAFATFQPRRIVPGSAGTAVPDGYRGHGELRHRSALRSADVFDAMEQDARARHDRLEDDNRVFVPPFTPGQVAMARFYRDLVERYEGKGVKCSSLETTYGGSDGAAFMDALVSDGEAVRKIRARVGRGVAMKVRRVRPSERGLPGASAITDRSIVDMVCLGGRTVSEVLKAHGWATKGSHRTAIRVALAASLDRMQGYAEGRRQDMG